MPPEIVLLGPEQKLVSPHGGVSPLEPCSLRWPHADASAKQWLTNGIYQSLLAKTGRLNEIVSQNFVRFALAELDCSTQNRWQGLMR
jgi:hypothetical protein